MEDMDTNYSLAVPSTPGAEDMRKTECPDCDCGLRPADEYEEHTVFNQDLRDDCYDDRCVDGHITIDYAEFAAIKEHDPLFDVNPDESNKEEDWLDYTCPSCEGDGDTATVCAEEGCDNTLNAYDDGWVVECEVYCEHHGVDRTCPTCEGEGEVIHQHVKMTGGDGTERTLTSMRAGFDCSLCGALAGEEGEEFRRRRQAITWFVYQAALLDTDGCYWARLCGDIEGGSGCLEDVLSQQGDLGGRGDVLETLKELMPDELNDAIIFQVRERQDIFGPQ